jgi:undecaprenyl-diphosphatase
MRYLTYLCSWPVIVAGAVLAVAGFGLRRRWQAALLVIVAVAGDHLIVYGLKTLIHRARPDQALALLPAAGYSFPSGHTFICIAFYGLLACLAYRGTRSGLLRAMIAAGGAALAVAVGTSRIYLGAHWPTDVLGSLLLGSAWVTLLVVGADLVRSRWRHPAGADESSAAD